MRFPEVNYSICKFAQALIGYLPDNFLKPPNNHMLYILYAGQYLFGMPQCLERYPFYSTTLLSRRNLFRNKVQLIRNKGIIIGVIHLLRG